MEDRDGIEVMVCEDVGAWESWLAANHANSSGVWLKIAKKHSGRSTVTIGEALDVALCYGWIDSIRRSYDDDYYLQRYGPRRPRSLWSKVNVGRVEALIAAGRMRPAGLAQVEAAKADGRWAAAYGPQRDATVPPDLAAALSANEKAKAFFDTLGKTDRYQVILRVITARTPERRAVVLDDTITTLESGQKI